ncbi:3,4-dihydroxy-2-butanone-4-phosphate synthase [Buchnera aphidicola str. APS (Acyrthosiphon pisum)]|uniref:3,4-dihydroxy-2-butanone 4-phosphate synthase n=3 Tax=Buchnera aphidicola TaxID=9 RepID=RIBB_BUCAI|nr:3,4-dihydroxy-2-butanone-4-phosphate synthase [Buchnera aphidicola]B8D6X1.1 RecName: Full=3,4-dihydroxy-2-butanone 4-phosphate synthase; Short=DHBP synthase [Buchnera aphidicola str. Tuc7 (Acyrthosiphon pisum)]B8D8L7.1 RecName: Full=3,4-dihydroxy-2-butanone 4-phosphate synthase; Short=DHBP synthase [Buchnera aphidicola str. 5A (Acyrthosiphon pisum)]P57167.1 RecName: Full=3,4-dihydroxy-2-butanone 4-phosphate synthase; Short=DHBP synthase [Buchnera aphidicola str. APS (Acyrthosiphon pisum)]pir
MNQTLLSKFGKPIERIKNAILALKSGQGVIILDDEERENEGDLVFACENMTVEQMALSIRYGSGIVCLCITESKRKQLNLPMMVKKNTSAYRTGFTVTIEASKGISTGVSAKDRLTTIKTAIADDAKPSDLNRPGHVFPLRAHKGGVLSRPGHTEAAIEIVSLAGFKPAGVICELTNKDGTMARTPEIIKFSENKKMQVLTIQDLIFYIKNINHL